MFVLLGSVVFVCVVLVYLVGMWVLMQQFCQCICLIFDEFEYVSEMFVDVCFV